jgi:hypothetical protein
VTKRGIHTESTEELSKNSSAILGKLDSLSNVNDPILASEKQLWPVDKTERGMQIDPNEQPRKHDSSMRTNRDSSSVVKLHPLSKVNDLILEPMNDSLPILLVDGGIQIEFKEQ